MKRLLSLVGTLVLSAGLAGTALADLTVAVPNGSEGDGLRAAAVDYSKLKGVKIEIVQAPYSNLFERAAELSPYFLDKIFELRDLDAVTDIRGYGLIAGIELVANKATRKNFDPEGHAGILCRDACMAHGVIVRATRDVIVMSPPLIITRSEIDELVAALAKALDETAVAMAGLDCS